MIITKERDKQHKNTQSTPKSKLMMLNAIRLMLTT